MAISKLKIATALILTAALLFGAGLGIHAWQTPPSEKLGARKAVLAAGTEPAARDRNNQDNGQRNQKDDGQRNQKDNGQRNQKDNGNQGQKGKDEAKEEKVPLDKLPKAVVDAVKRRFPDAKLVSAEKELEDGKTVYEVAIDNKGQKIEVMVTPAGKIFLLEKLIAAKDMPSAVVKTLETKFPKATIEQTEEVIKVDKEEKLTHYEVILVTAQKKKLEVCVSPDGKIVSTEKK